MREDRAFIYMDEYFQIEGVADLFDEFCEAVKGRGLVARYVRDAGAFGALFVLMRNTKSGSADAPGIIFRTAKTADSSRT